MNKIEVDEKMRLDLQIGDLVLFASYKYDRTHRMIDGVPYTIGCLCYHNDKESCSNVLYNFTTIDGNTRTETLWDWSEKGYDIYLFHRPKKAPTSIHMADASKYIKKEMRNREVFG